MQGRPRIGKNDDLEEMQRQFLQSSERPAATAVRATTKPKSVSFAADVKPGDSTPPVGGQPQRRGVSMHQALRLVKPVVERSPTTPPSFVPTLESVDGFPKTFKLTATDTPFAVNNAAGASKTTKKKKSLFALSMERTRIGNQAVQEDPSLGGSPAVTPNSASSVTPNAASSSTPSSASPIADELDAPDIHDVRLHDIDDKTHMDNIQLLQQMTSQELDDARREIMSRIDGDTLKGLMAHVSRTKPDHPGTTHGHPITTQDHPSAATPDPANPPDQQHPTSPTRPTHDSVAESLFKAELQDTAAQDQAQSDGPLDLSWIQTEEDLRDATATLLPEAEREKLQWMRPATGDADKTDDKEVPQPRFDLMGALVNSADDAEYDPKLYHHGDDADKPGYTIGELVMLMRSTVAGQRALALRSIAGLLKARCDAIWLGDSRVPHPLRTLPEELGLLIRCAVDDDHPAVLRRALEALHMYLVPVQFERERAELSCLYFGNFTWAPLARAQGGPGYYGQAADFGNRAVLKKKTESGEEEDPTDQELLNARPVEGMIKCGLLQRLSFLLGFGNGDHAKRNRQVLDGESVMHCLSVIQYIVRHSSNSARAVVEHEQIMQGLVGLVEVSETVLLPPQTPAKRIDIQAATLSIQIFVTLCQHKRAFVTQLADKGVFDSVKRFVGMTTLQKYSGVGVVAGGPNSAGGDGDAEPNAQRAPIDGTDDAAVLDNEEHVFQLWEQVVHLWRVNLTYGLDSSSFLTLLPAIAQLGKFAPKQGSTKPSTTVTRLRCSVNLLIAAYFNYCVDDLRESMDLDEVRNTTEIGERLVHLVDDVVRTEKDAVNDVVQSGKGDADNGEVAMLLSSRLRFVTCFGHLLMGPQPLLRSAGFAKTLGAEPSGAQDVPAPLPLREWVGTQEADVASSVGSFSGSVRESIARTIGNVAVYVLRLAGRIQPHMEEVLRRFSALRASSRENDPTTLCYMEWCLSLVEALSMCVDASLQYGVQVAGRDLLEALRQTDLVQGALTGLLASLTDEQGWFSSQVKIPVSPRKAYLFRTRVMLVFKLSEFLIRVQGRCAGTRHTELSLRRRMVIWTGSHASLFSGDEWVARNAVGALLSPYLLGSVDPTSHKSDVEAVTNGQRFLHKFFINALGGEEAVQRSFSSHMCRCHRIQTLVVGQPNETGVVFSESMTAWPLMAMRMSPDESKMEQETLDEVSRMLLHLARLIRCNLRAQDVLVMLLRFLIHTKGNFFGDPETSELFVSLISEAAATMDAANAPFHEQLLNAAGGTKRKLMTICSRVLDNYVDDSYACVAMAYAPLTFLRGSMVDSEVYVFTLKRLIEGQLVGSLDAEQVLGRGRDEGQSNADRCEEAWKSCLLSSQQVTEPVADLYTRILAERLCDMESNRFMYRLSVCHVAAFLVRPGTEWTGEQMLRDIQNGGSNGVVDHVLATRDAFAAGSKVEWGRWP